ncbi:MAG TPA: hypothetical protein VK699_02830 [Terriglobales bacterium]|jgi:hypothetical protein|nr:hypothetical protein [Terriglobales bacterium]
MLRSILTGKLVVLLSFVLLSSLAPAQFRTVTVQNDPSNPVPTTIQNGNPIPITVQNTDPLSVNANITNVPQVTVGGTVSTAVVNVPTVNVNGTVPVAVGNTVSSAIVNVPTVNVNGTVPVTVGSTVSAAITNVPTVNVNGTVPVTVGSTVSTAITNVPTVNVNGTVPVAVGNTVSSAIVNVPTVNVNGTVPISGAVTAAITNVPTVNVNGTVPVSVTNLPLGTIGTGTTVVLVKNLENTLLQQVFQTSLSCATSPGLGSNCTAAFNVPAGKQLMVEYLQVVSKGNVANGMHHFEIQTIVSGQPLTYFYGPGNKLLSDTASDDRLVRIYADPGSTVQLTGVQGMPGPGITFNLLLSGHLIDVQ